jgi:hypothetical protein
MTFVARPLDPAIGSGDFTPATRFPWSAALDPRVQERRRVLAAEAAMLSERARHIALQRWRGLAPDAQAG